MRGKDAHDARPPPGVFVSSPQAARSTFDAVASACRRKRDTATASLFGLGPVMDVFAFSFRVPNLARQLFGEGALSAAFLLENVKNLERHDKGKTFATIMNVLRNELGYHVSARVISSAPWVPQKRERIFIAGFREPTSFDLNDLVLPSVDDGPKLGSILDRHEDVDPKYTLTPKLWEYLQNYKEKVQWEHYRA